jgi:hypothetical protein
MRWATAVQCLPPTTVYRYCSLKNNVLWTKKGQSCEAAAMWWSGFVFSFSEPAKIPAPPFVRDDPPRDTGTKEERPCGSAVEPRRGEGQPSSRDGTASGRGNPTTSLLASTVEKSLGWQY